MSAWESLVFVPLGGVGEIGMNLALYGLGDDSGRTWLMVDCGIGFAGHDLPGVDLIMPDIRFAEGERNNLAGIVITHAHEDHFGGLLYLWDRLRAPIYATPFVAHLLEAKLLSEPGAPDIPIRVTQQGDTIEAGPYSVEFIPVSHSIPEPNALAIRTSVGTVIHTADWKVDPEPGIGKAIATDRFKALGREGVLALVCDSTNAVSEGRGASEADAARTLADIVKHSENRVAVTTFASNVARIRSIAEAARLAGRDVVVIGRALIRTITVARELGYLDGIADFLDEDAYGYLPRDKVLAICTGSQGESRAALARIARGDHRSVELARGDLVIFSSRNIPGNEKDIGKVINGLAAQGVDVITDDDAQVHVSGHARRDELRDMYTWVKPEVAVPVHGEPIHLAEHAKLAEDMKVKSVVRATNGDMVLLGPGEAEVIDEVPFGRLYRDGNILVFAEESGVTERRKLSYAGIVAVALVLDRKGTVVSEPDVALSGLPDADSDGEPFEDVVFDSIDGALRSIPRTRRRDADVVRQAVSRAVRSTVADRWGKKPICHVLISVV